MKNSAIVHCLIFLVFVPALVFAGDFRSADFGMSQAAVKATEPQANWGSDDDDIIGFETTIAGLEALALYVFINGQMSRGVYMVTEPHSNKTQYISDYSSLAGLLTKKYGKPISEDTYWSDDLYRDDPSSWGMAVATGSLSKFTMWKNESAEIGLSLIGDNFKISLSVEYASKEFAELEQRKRESDTLNDL